MARVNAPPQSPHDGDLPRQADLRALGNPIDFIAADHQHARRVCAFLDRVAAGAPEPAESLGRALAFFREELPHHLADEEYDLYPLMKRRCEPEDRIADTIDRLSSDHAHVRAGIAKVSAVLARCLDERNTQAGSEARAFLSTYTSHARRHLIVENAIVLPLARARLTRSDLDILLLRMLRRRGLDQVMGV